MTSTSIADSKRFASPPAYPPAPHGRVLYVIGDIHGRRDILEKVFRAIDGDKARVRDQGQNRARAQARMGARILTRSWSSVPDCLPSPPAALEIYLGDYIDRGEDSRGVIDALLERAENVEAVFLRGNHEQLLLDFLAGTVDLSMWKQVGGGATLQSYGVQAGQRSFLASEATVRQALEEALPNRHARFFADTVPYFLVEPYLFVHAGVRPGIPLKQQHPSDLMGIRRQFLEFDGDLGHIVVHGHTPAPQPEFKHNRINLDTCAYSTGCLTCLRIGRDGAKLLGA